MSALEPGRYTVLGGPGGYTMVRRAEHLTGNGHALIDGRDYVRTRDYTDKWTPLARFRVRPGQVVTHYGVLDAVMRVWKLT